MNRTQLLEFHAQLAIRAREIMKQKNHDYSGPEGNDPFANFRRCEEMRICKTEQGFLVRICDKLSRLSTFVESGSLLVKDESVQDTLLDLINYSILLAAYLKETRDASNSRISPE